MNTPIALTGTGSLGIVMHSVARYLARAYPDFARNEIAIPVVAECDDGFLHDHLTFALTEEDVWAALDAASTDPVEEGCVGAGTGMALFGFKGGIGSASRVVAIEAGTYTVAVLVETNFGRRPQLTVAGVPVGRAIPDLLPEIPTADGSCIVVVATDAPLHAHTLRRLAKRAGLGLARTGSTAGDGSGEIILAFSTAQRIPYRVPGGRLSVEVLSEGSYDNTGLNTIFSAVVEATEEAVINALLAATTTRGRDGHLLHALPHDRLKPLLEHMSSKLS
jgi:D-aminopeptidase